MHKAHAKKNHTHTKRDKLRKIITHKKFNNEADDEMVTNRLNFMFVQA